MFYYDRGLKLTETDLAIDVRRRQPRAFVSHAHVDHMARHELALCSPPTARLYQLRMGVRPVLEMPYGQPLEWGGLRLTSYPAGHCLGSAMLLVESDQGSLLYTGDFKLSGSLTAEPAELPRADRLVIESTYGDPRYRLPPREEAVAQLLDAVRIALDRGETPVIRSYALGKSQEVTRLLTAAGIPVLQHRDVHEVSCAYEELGVALGDFALYPGYPRPGHAVIVPPYIRGAAEHLRIDRACTIAVSGWAADPSTCWRLRADVAVPLSDHADFDELLEAVGRVGPREVYCTHGPASFVEHLRAAGWRAQRLEDRVE